MAVAYMLDPSKDYVDPAGGHHTDRRKSVFTSSGSTPAWRRKCFVPTPTS